MRGRPVPMSSQRFAVVRSASRQMRQTDPCGYGEALGITCIFCHLWRRATNATHSYLRYPDTGPDGVRPVCRAAFARRVSLAERRPGDWPTFNRTLAGDRFSPLTEIDRSNVARLTVSCRYQLPEVTALQTGPIVMAGTMFFTTDTISYAIDAATCEERWKSVRHSPSPSRLAVNRGAAYLDGRSYRGTSDAHVIALDAANGQQLWDVTLDVAGPGVTLPMAPTAWQGLVSVGNAGGDLSGIIGHVYALDAKDGHVVWRFDVVPDTGAARSTWPAADRYPIFRWCVLDGVHAR